MTKKYQGVWVKSKVVSGQQIRRRLIFKIVAICFIIAIPAAIIVIGVVKSILNG